MVTNCDMATTRLLKALHAFDMATIRECSDTLFAFRRLDDDTLIKRIAEEMCFGERVVGREAFKIFNACRNMMCQYFDEDVDLALVCSWGPKIKQTESGRFIFI